MINRTYQAGDTLTFANRFIGCVTLTGKLALVAPNGRTATGYYPLVGDYVGNNKMIKWEDSQGDVVWEDLDYTLQERAA